MNRIKTYESFDDKDKIIITNNILNYFSVEWVEDNILLELKDDDINYQLSRCSIIQNPNRYMQHYYLDKYVKDSTYTMYHKYPKDYIGITRGGSQNIYHINFDNYFAVSEETINELISSVDKLLEFKKDLLNMYNIKYDRLYWKNFNIQADSVIKKKIPDFILYM